MKNMNTKGLQGQVRKVAGLEVDQDHMVSLQRVQAFGVRWRPRS